MEYCTGTGRCPRVLLAAQLMQASGGGCLTITVRAPGRPLWAHHRGSVPAAVNAAETDRVWLIRVLLDRFLQTCDRFLSCLSGCRACIAPPPPNVASWTRTHHSRLRPGRCTGRHRAAGTDAQLRRRVALQRYAGAQQPPPRCSVAIGTSQTSDYAPESAPRLAPALPAGLPARGRCTSSLIRPTVPGIPALQDPRQLRLIRH